MGSEMCIRDRGYSACALRSRCSGLRSVYVLGALGFDCTFRARCRGGMNERTFGLEGLLCDCVCVRVALGFMVLGRLRHNSMRSTDYTKTFPTLDGYSFHQTHADTHRDTRRHTHSHKGAWRLPQVPRSRRAPGGRARCSAAASARRSASDPHSPQPRCTAAASTLQDILAPEDGGRWRWCCGLVDRVALGGRSHQTVTGGEPSPSRRGRGAVSYTHLTLPTKRRV